jgi:hypothetical protein
MASGPCPTVVVGTTFWYPRGSGPSAVSHLWFVLHVAADGEILAANATDFSHVKTEACTLLRKDGRHPSISKDSVMHFNYARRITRKQFETWYREGQLILDQNASRETMEYIRHGFLKSGHTTPAARNFFLGKIPVRR